MFLNLLKKKIETVAARKACSYYIAKDVQQLHDGNVVITKGQAHYHSKTILIIRQMYLMLQYQKVNEIIQLVLQRFYKVMNVVW